MTEVVPTTLFGELGDGFGQQRAGFVRLAKKKRRHTAVEEHGSARRLLLPKRDGFLDLTTVPGQGAFLVRPRRLPTRGRGSLVSAQQLGRVIELAPQAENAGGEQHVRVSIFSGQIVGPLA